MLAVILQFLATAAIIIVAGSALARFADAIAELTQLGRLLIGSILLAGATSLPELAVDIHAIRIGKPDLAVGDLAGSCLFNLLILALIDLTQHSRGQMFSRVAAAHALSGAVSICLMALAAISIYSGHLLPWKGLWGISGGCFVILLTYLMSVRLIFQDQRISARLSEQQSGTAEVSTVRLTLPRAVAGLLLSAAVIVVSGPFLTEAAGELAELTRLGNTFLGSSLVAFCTSLPELVATIAAVRLGAIDLAIGNIYGSNAFNVLLLIPLDLFSPGFLLSEVSTVHTATYLCTIMITSVAVAGQLYHVEQRIRFVEPDALLVILLVFLSLVLNYLLTVSL